MKKFIFTLSCLILIISCSALFSGCQSNNDANSNEDNFIEVYSLTYTTNLNSLYTRYSTYSIEYDIVSLVEISEDDFNTAPDDYKVFYEDLTQNISKDKSNLPKFHIGDYIYLYRYGSHFKVLCTNIEYRYLSVSIVDNRTIKIKAYDGSITILSSDYYAIEYFNV